MMTENLQLRLEALSLADQCLVHRVLYYVLMQPVMGDRQYDILERAATNDPDTPVDHLIHQPGSDLESTYPDEIVSMAYEITNPELQS